MNETTVKYKNSGAIRVGKPITGYKMFVKESKIKINGGYGKQMVWTGPYRCIPRSWKVKPGALLRSREFDEDPDKLCAAGVNFCPTIKGFMEFRSDSLHLMFPKRDYGKMWVLYEGHVPRGARFVQPLGFDGYGGRVNANKCRSTSFRLKRRVRKDELWKKSKRS
jgi:hypothetical protein